MEARSKYSKIFDSNSVEWNTDQEYNLMFLESMKRFMNDKLKVYGYVFLNEVYTHLGLPITKAGQIVGWRYDEKNPIGDNYIDFGVYIDEEEPDKIYLDFNVDGDILQFLKD